MGWFNRPSRIYWRQASPVKYHLEDEEFDQILRMGVLVKLSRGFAPTGWCRPYRDGPWRLRPRGIAGAQVVLGKGKSLCQILQSARHRAGLELRPGSVTGMFFSPGFLAPWMPLWGLCAGSLWEGKGGRHPSCLGPAPRLSRGINLYLPIALDC